MEGVNSVSREQIRDIARYQQKAEKQEGGVQAKQAAAGEAASIDLKQPVGQAEAKMLAARQTLRANEAVLREVKDGVDRMESLAREAAAEGAPDREVLGEELSKLRQELMRLLGGTAGLPLSDSAAQSPISQLPAWLLLAMADSPDPDQLLAALGLDKSAGGSEIMAALAKLPLEDPGAGYLAAVYLGAVIAGGGTDKLDPEMAAQGLLRLLEAMRNGLAPDEAVTELTNGLFDSLEDFQQQFLDGMAPGMEAFFSNLLFSGGFSMPDLMDLLSGGGMGETDLLMTLLAALDAAVGMLPELGGSGEATGETQDPAAQQASQSQDMGGFTAEGRELTGVAYDAESNAVTVSGDEKVILRGRGEQTSALELRGQGQVEIRNANAARVTVDNAKTQLYTKGETELHELSFKEKATLTLAGSGLTRLGDIKGGPDNVLRLKEGAFILERQAAELPIRVVIEGAVMLQVPRESHVFNALGEELEPYDLMWKSMFPGWSSLEGMTIDGRHAQMMLLRSAQPDLARLWLLKGDPSQGYPAHLIALEGRGRSEELQTRYVYLQWSRMQRKFIPISMFPNPFTVTGGEEDVDWRYEEDSRTLRVLTGKVTGLKGGAGTDAVDRPFSGRLALADGIGAVELTLDGVTCRVPSGRACSLGSGNRVTLLLKCGTESLFESGAGCAGISLGDGTSLYIDQTRATGQPDGALTARGGAASPGIGRDSGHGKGRTASIMIRGGRVTTVEGRRESGGGKPPRRTLAGLSLAARALKLDAMDISTKEAASDAVRQLSAGRRWVNRLQEAYRAVYGKLGQSLSDPGSISRYAQAVQNGEEAGALMWEMRREMEKPSVSPYSRWETEDVDQLLKAMEDMINQ